jgi:hypothetical protein
MLGRFPVFDMKSPAAAEFRHVAQSLTIPLPARLLAPANEN